MDADDLEPVKARTGAPNLEAMSIAALHDYVTELEAEMARVRSTIKTKEAAKAAAASVFGS